MDTLKEHLNKLKEGYIGVTKYPINRFKRHQLTNRVPIEAVFDIIFIGSRKECFELEEQLRPTSFIGWNNARGGSHGWRYGFKHSDDTKKKLKDVWTETRREKTSNRIKEQNKLSRGKKRPAQSIAISGDKNGMFGKHHTEEARNKISVNQKGKPGHNKQELYCIFCRKRVNKTFLKKYHGEGKTACTGKINILILKENNMKVVCLKLNSGEEILGRLVESGILLSGSSSQYDGSEPWNPTGSVTLEMVRGITAQQINKNEMAIAFFPWSLGNQDGKFTFDLDNCACAVYSAEKEVEDGYLQQTSKIQLARAPGIKM